MYSNVTTSTRINILQCTYVHLRLFHSKLHSTLRVILQGFVTQNATDSYAIEQIAQDNNNIWIPQKNPNV